MDMYSSTVNVNDYNITLDGYDMIMEELTPNESYNRRETIRHNIIGGTQSVMRGNYLPRDYSFITHFLIDPDYPDVYDSILREWQSKPVTVNSKHMGGEFKAEVIIKKSPSTSPNYLSLEIQVIEIPDTKSLIPNEEILLPSKSKKNVSVTKDKNTKKNKKDTKKLYSNAYVFGYTNSKGNKITHVKKND